MTKIVIGSGGGGKGGGGGSARTPVEYPNSLRSKSYAKIVEVLCEGEIEGLVAGHQSIFIDNTPLQNSDGSYNFSDVIVEMKSGSLLQTPSSISEGVEVTNNVGTELKYNVPIEYTINNPDVDQARVSIRVPQLTQQNTENGDLGGTTVVLKVEYNSNGSGWVSPPVSLDNFSVPLTGITGVSSVSLSANVTPACKYGKIYYYGEETTVLMALDTTFAWQVSVNGGNYTTISTYKPTTTNSSVESVFQASMNLIQTNTYSFKCVVLSKDSKATQQPTISNTQANATKYTSNITISGKTTSPYERDIQFALAGNAPWIIRVTRLTVDSTSTALNNKTYFATCTTIWDEKFVYPATAYVAMSINAEQFSSIPSRAYEVRLKKIKIPSNYNPRTREYTGLWDGTFVVAWSDNPAWCFYDLVTNSRFGLGDRVSEDQLDKWQLYTIAQYCDELVDGGYGIATPRFTCNVLIQTREDAYKVIQDFCSIFAATPFWASDRNGNAGIHVVQDSPIDNPVYAFNNSNVVDGTFNYSTTNITTKYNACYVTYNEPTNAYKQSVMYVPDDEDIAKTGIVREVNVTAFGCTDKAQAYRFGRRILYTNKYEGQMVNFVCGMDGAIPSVGDVISISDTLKAGERRGGRVYEVVDGETVRIDKEFDFSSGAYQIIFIDKNGNHIEKNILSTTSTNLVVVDDTSQISKNSIYIITDSQIQDSLWKVVGCTENTQDFTYAISACYYNASKYDYIDNLGALVFESTTGPFLFDPVTNIEHEEVLYKDNTSVKSKLVISWTPAKYSVRYSISYYSDVDQNPVTVDTSLPTVEILDTVPTTYYVKITSINLFGSKSNPVSKEIEVYGRLYPPKTPTNFEANSSSGVAYLRWDNSPDLDVIIGGKYEIRYSSNTVNPSWEDGTFLTEVSGAINSATVPLLNGVYMLKAIDSSGIYCVLPAIADSEYAILQQWNVVATTKQQPSWLGIKEGFTIDTSNHRMYLSSTITVDDILLIDGVNDWDSSDNCVLSAAYYFDDCLDIGSTMSVRVTSNVTTYAFSTMDYIDARDWIDDWETVDGTAANNTYGILYISTTDQDPSGSPVWSEWKQFVVSDYVARAFRFKFVATNDDPKKNLEVSQLEVSCDVPDRVEGEENLICPVDGYTVKYRNKPFFSNPAVAIRIDNMQLGDYYEITNKTNSGFTIKFKNSSNTHVQRQFDYVAKGWGYVIN